MGAEMRIGLVCYGLFPENQRGGIQYFVLRLARALSEIGKHEVHIITNAPRNAAPPNAERHVHLLPVRWLPVVGRWLPGLGESVCMAIGISNLNRRYHFDVFEFWNWEFPGLVYSAVSCAPIVTRIATCFAETMKIDGLHNGIQERFQCWAERAAVRRSTRLVTHTNAHRVTVAHTFGVCEDSIRLVPLGIDVSAAPEEESRNEEGGAIQLLYVGRMEHRKGTIDLLRALPLVYKKMSDFRLTLVGSDRPHAPGNRTFAEYADAELPPAIRRRVTFEGVVDDDRLDRYYRECDFLVAPSLYESFGLIYLEAMRYGKPVIGCRVGGIPEVVCDKKTGLLVPPSCPEDLADAMLMLMQDSSLRCEMGKNAYAWVRDHFSMEAVVAKSEALYEDAMAGRRGTMT